ncbi:hypothetical protein ElyMa_004687400 [Elysia marginata]|uniref:Uncharacterized protein n=1 Tax=Elysia marginata TaxID=1093978 RepID=A0AAV4I968_9GAST|nr:hypothetical protein ElyMa_004687400 [Elysia marginata]
MTITPVVWITPASSEVVGPVRPAVGAPRYQKPRAVNLPSRGKIATRVSPLATMLLFPNLIAIPDCDGVETLQGYHSPSHQLVPRRKR